MKLDRRQMLAATGGALASVTLPDALFAQQSGRKILIIASNQDIPNFDPHIATGYSASMLLRNVYDSLVRVEGNPPKPVPHLADLVDGIGRRSRICLQARSGGEIP